jgi:hypothetical protein
LVKACIAAFFSSLRCLTSKTGLTATLFVKRTTKDGFVLAYALHALSRLGRLEATPKLRKFIDGKHWCTGGYFDSTFVLTRDDRPNPEPIRQALRNYDLSRIDSARLGKPAPDFTLEDASGKTWHLGQFRGKKAVVLIFLQGIN